jgi:hypothetical protein
MSLFDLVPNNVYRQYRGGDASGGQGSGNMGGDNFWGYSNNAPPTVKKKRRINPNPNPLPVAPPYNPLLPGVMQPGAAVPKPPRPKPYKPKPQPPVVPTPTPIPTPQPTVDKNGMPLISTNREQTINNYYGQQGGGGFIPEDKKKPEDKTTVTDNTKPTVTDTKPIDYRVDPEGYTRTDAQLPGLDFLPGALGAGLGMLNAITPEPQFDRWKTMQDWDKRGESQYKGIWGDSKTDPYQGNFFRNAQRTMTTGTNAMIEQNAAKTEQQRLSGGQVFAGGNQAAIAASAPSFYQQTGRNLETGYDIRNKAADFRKEFNNTNTNADYINWEEDYKAGRLQEQNRGLALVAGKVIPAAMSGFGQGMDLSAKWNDMEMNRKLMERGLATWSPNGQGSSSITTGSSVPLDNTMAGSPNYNQNKGGYDGTFGNPFANPSSTTQPYQIPGGDQGMASTAQPTTTQPVNPYLQPQGNFATPDSRPPQGEQPQTTQPVNPFIGPTDPRRDGSMQIGGHGTGLVFEDDKAQMQDQLRRKTAYSPLGLAPIPTNNGDRGYEPLPNAPIPDSTASIAKGIVNLGTSFIPGVGSLLGSAANFGIDSLFGKKKKQPQVRPSFGR